MTSRDQIPVLAVGWDVGGWLGEKQGVAVAELSGDGTRWFIPTKPFCANDACMLNLVCALKNPTRTGTRTENDLTGPVSWPTQQARAGG